MLSRLLSVAVALPLVAATVDLLDDNRQVQQPGLIRYPIHPKVGAPVVKNVTRRQNDVGLENQRTGYFYTIDIELGTPGQVVSVNLDTGSAELWVNPVCETSVDPAFCETFDRFTESSSFVDLGQQGQLAYGTGYANIEYGYDFITVGSARVRQQIFGVAYESSFLTTGILGMGPFLDGWDSLYPLLIDSLVDQGFINSRAFSLDIRSIDSDRGSVVYGGIDTKKYTGALENRPIVPAAESPDGYTRYWVNLDGINIVLPDGEETTIFSETNGVTVLLDSGYTISALPGPIFQGIVDTFPTARLIPGTEDYEVDCSVAELEGTVDFIFGETTINVPYADFVWEQPEYETCILGVFQDDEFPVLGDTFLRAAYVVYDWDNLNIWLANNEDCGSNLVAIGSGPDAVPSLVGECGSEPTPTDPPTETETETATETDTDTKTKTTEKPTTTTGWSNSTTTSSGSWTTSIHTSTKTYTITSCPPTVTSCPVGSVTTEIVTSYTTFCPEVTATYTFPKTYTESGHTYTTSNVVTVRPNPTQSEPTKIPGCTTCAPPPADSTSAGPPPPIGQPSHSPNATQPTGPPPVPTAGAAEWRASGVAVLAAGVLAVLAM